MREPAEQDAFALPLRNLDGTEATVAEAIARSLCWSDAEGTCSSCNGAVRSRQEIGAGLPPLLALELNRQAVGKQRLPLQPMRLPDPADPAADLSYVPVASVH